jgi:hypothetical protein
MQFDFIRSLVGEVFEFAAQRVWPIRNRRSGTGFALLATEPGCVFRLRRVTMLGAHPIEENSIYVEAWIGFVIFIRRHPDFVGTMGGSAGGSRSSGF